MARKRTRPRKKDKDHGLDVEKLDQLLDLPDIALYQILSNLPTFDVVRLSVLSKQWRRVWCSMPNLNFSDSSYPVITTFCRNVGKCLRLRAAQDSPITGFRLDISHSWRWSTIDRWLRLVSKSGLWDLDISISSRPRRWYRLAHDFLRIRSLTCVRLVGVEVKGLESSVRLPFLLSLSLEKVNMDDQVLHNLISGCSSLKRLCVHTCRGLSSPKVSSSGLEFLEIWYSDRGEKFLVKTLNLQSFVCRNAPASLESKLSLNRTLRNLSFIDSKFDDLWLEDLLFTVPLLKILTLRKCINLKHVKIHGPSLKGFTFDGNGKSGHAVATVNSPNLVYFSYRGYLLPNFSMNPENLLEAHIRLYKRKNYCEEWFADLLSFLSKLNCSETLSLDVHSEKALIFTRLVKAIFPTPLPRLKHMKVRTKHSSVKSELIEALNWASPSLETFSTARR